MDYYQPKKKNKLVPLVIVGLSAMGVFYLWNGRTVEDSVDDNTSVDSQVVEEADVPTEEEEILVEEDDEPAESLDPSGYIEACQFVGAHQPWLRGILLDEVSGLPIEVPNIESPGQVQVWIDSRAQGLGTPILSGGCFDFAEGLSDLVEMGYDIYSYPLVLEITYGDPFAFDEPDQTVIKEVYAQPGQDLEMILHVPGI